MNEATSSHPTRHILHVLLYLDSDSRTVLGHREPILAPRRHSDATLRTGAAFCRGLGEQSQDRVSDAMERFRSSRSNDRSHRSVSRRGRDQDRDSPINRLSGAIARSDLLLSCIAVPIAAQHCHRAVPEPQRRLFRNRTTRRRSMCSSLPSVVECGHRERQYFEDSGLRSILRRQLIRLGDATVVPENSRTSTRSIQWAHKIERWTSAAWKTESNQQPSVP